MPPKGKNKDRAEDEDGPTRYNNMNAEELDKRQRTNQGKVSRKSALPQQSSANDRAGKSTAVKLLAKALKKKRQAKSKRAAGSASGNAFTGKGQGYNPEYDLSGVLNADTYTEKGQLDQMSTDIKNPDDLELWENLPQNWKCPGENGSSCDGTKQSYTTSEIEVDGELFFSCRCHKCGHIIDSEDFDNILDLKADDLLDSHGDIPSRQLRKVDDPQIKALTEEVRTLKVTLQEERATAADHGPILAEHRNKAQLFQTTYAKGTICSVVLANGHRWLCICSGSVKYESKEVQVTYWNFQASAWINSTELLLYEPTIPDVGFIQHASTGLALDLHDFNKMYFYCQEDRALPLTDDSILAKATYNNNRFTLHADQVAFIYKCISDNVQYNEHVIAGLGNDWLDKFETAQYMLNATVFLPATGNGKFACPMVVQPTLGKELLIDMLYPVIGDEEFSTLKECRLHNISVKLPKQHQELFLKYVALMSFGLFYMQIRGVLDKLTDHLYDTLDAWIKQHIHDGLCARLSPLVKPYEHGLARYRVNETAVEREVIDLISTAAPFVTYIDDALCMDTAGPSKASVVALAPPNAAVRNNGDGTNSVVLACGIGGTAYATPAECQGHAEGIRRCLHTRFPNQIGPLSTQDAILVEGLQKREIVRRLCAAGWPREAFGCNRVTALPGASLVTWSPRINMRSALDGPYALLEQLQYLKLN